MAVQEATLPLLHVHPQALEMLVQLEAGLVPEPWRTGGHPVGNGEGIGITRKGGIVAQGGQLAQHRWRVRSSRDVYPEGETGGRV